MFEYASLVKEIYSHRIDVFANKLNMCVFCYF